MEYSYNETSVKLGPWQDGKKVFPFYVVAQDRFTPQKTVGTISNSKVISDFPSLRD